MLCGICHVVLRLRVSTTPHSCIRDECEAICWDLEGSFQGNAFLTIALHIDGNKIVGTVSHANIELNNAGELTKAEANDSEAPDPITDLRVDGNILRITTKSTDGSEDSIQAKLTLIAADDAELQMIVPPDVPRA